VLGVEEHGVVELYVGRGDGRVEGDDLKGVDEAGTLVGDAAVTELVCCVVNMRRGDIRCDVLAVPVADGAAAGHDAANGSLGGVAAETVAAADGLEEERGNTGDLGKSVAYTCRFGGEGSMGTHVRSGHAGA
jgi:hypothetical protein